MRKMIVILGLTLALVSLFGLTGAVFADKPPDCPDGQHYDQQAEQCVDNGPAEDPTAEPTAEATDEPTAEPTSEPTDEPGFQPVTLCHASPTGEGNSGPANSYELITVDNQGQLNGHLNHPNDIIPAPDGGCPVINPTATSEPTEEGRPTTTATPERCDPGECATPTPKPPHHPGTGPEDSAAIFGWLTTMGIGLASAGIAGMRRR